MWKAAAAKAKKRSKKMTVEQELCRGPFIEKDKTKPHRVPGIAHAFLEPSLRLFDPFVFVNGPLHHLIFHRAPRVRASGLLAHSFIITIVSHRGSLFPSSGPIFFIILRGNKALAVPSSQT